MKPPAFQFYPDDFIAGTADLSPEEVGAYIRLLCHQWNRGCIPVETERQQRLAGGSVSVEVLKKFKLIDGELKNERLETERDKQSLFREKQSLKGKASAEKRARLNHGSTAVEIRLQPEVNSPSPSPYIDAHPLNAREEASTGEPTGDTWETSRPTGSRFPQDEPEAPVSGQDSSPPSQTPPAAASGSNHPTLEEVKTTASMRGVPENVAELFWNDRESVGWVDGRGQPIHKWQASLWAFWTRYQANEQKTKQLNEQRQRSNSGPGSNARPDRTTGTLNEGYQLPEHLVTKC